MIYVAILMEPQIQSKVIIDLALCCSQMYTRQRTSPHDSEPSEKPQFLV